MATVRRSALAFAWAGALLFAASLVVFLHAYFAAFGRPEPAGPAARDMLVNVGLFSVFALHHSVLARAGPKALMSRVVSPELERSVYVWTASILLIAVCLLWRPLPGELYRFEGPVAAVCYALQIGAVIMTIRTSSRIGILDLAGLRPALAERHDVNAPHAEESGHGPLRTSGLYRYVRHPMYLAWFILVFGTPHMTMTRFVFAVTSAAYLALAIPFEERGLIRVFGDDYRRYQHTVRWRMLPWVY